MTRDDIDAAIAAFFAGIDGTEARVDAVNYVRGLIAQHSPFASEPVDYVRWIPADLVAANDYNPNSVAPPEMELLRLSIMADGYHPAQERRIRALPGPDATPPRTVGRRRPDRLRAARWSTRTPDEGGRMTATVILQRNNRSSWLRLRSRGLGGTDVAAVLGFDRWRTQLDVWLDKTGRGERTPSSYPMRRGTYMEAWLLREYARAHPGAIVEKPPALLAHPEYPIIRASLDGLAHHRDRTVIVDAKSVGWRARGDWWDEEKVCPDTYAVQMLTYLAVTGLDEAVLVADVAGEYREVVIERDTAWEDAALPLLDRWWAEHVVADVPPPIDWERDSIPSLNRTWVTEPGTAVEATQAVAGAVEAYRVMSDKAATFKRLTEALRVQIREGMGTAQVLTIGGEKAASLDSRGTLRVSKSTTNTETGH